MIETINTIIQTTLESFDFAYCIVTNVLTYFIITTINARQGHKDITLWHKRIILILVILFTGLIYWLIGADTKVLLNSAILSPVFWSWILKPVCKKFKIDYNDINLFE